MKWEASDAEDHNKQNFNPGLIPVAIFIVSLYVLSEGCRLKETMCDTVQASISQCSLAPPCLSDT